MTEPKIGSVQDYHVKVLTALNAELVHSTLSDISIDDRKLSQEASDLPQTMFYHNAVFQRISHQCEIQTLELKELRARARITLIENYRSQGNKITVDEVDARIDLDPPIMEKSRRVAELRSMRDTIDGVLSSLRQKGYSLQMIAQLKSKEEDWLRRSFQDRLKDHPNKDQILSLFTQLLGN